MPREIEGVSCVLLGAFNPAIFHPQWLARHGLVRETEAVHAAIQLITADVALFNVAGFELKLLPNRASFATIDLRLLPALRDLVVGVFSILAETPVRALGINREMHCRCPGPDSWHKVGNTLAPKDLWKDLLANPGMRSLTIEGQRPGESSKFVQFKIEPSLLVQPGVFVAFNEHYDVDVTGACETLKKTWEQSLSFGLEGGEKILERILESS